MNVLLLVIGYLAIGFVLAVALHPIKSGEIPSSVVWLLWPVVIWVIVLISVLNAIEWMIEKTSDPVEYISRLIWRGK